MFMYDPFAGAWVWTIIAVVFAVIWIIPAIFFLLNLRDLLRQVRPQNQAMEPNQVWLNLIPLFNIVWMFVTVIKVRDSVQAEFRARGWAPLGDYGFGIGLAAAILSVLGWLGIVGLICWIIYWVRMSEFKNLLMQGQPAAGWLPVSPPSGQWGTDQTAGGYGTPTPQASGRSCPFCGTAYGPEARFCSSCGRPVA